MPMIRPCADLHNNYSEISDVCHSGFESVFITKNGKVLILQGFSAFAFFGKWFKKIILFFLKKCSKGG